MVFLKKRGFFILFFSLLITFFLILTSVSVLGLGVSPGKVVLRFIPNYEYEREVCFSTYKIAHLQLNVTGDLAEYITLPQEEMIGGGCITYKLKMPASFEKPGRHEGVVMAKEVSEDVTGAIFALVRVGHRVIIEVPYPGKYIEIRYFRAENVDAGEVVPFLVEFESKGNQSIESVYGLIYVYDKDEKLIGSIRTNTVENIEPGDIKYLRASWDSGVYREGNYHAFLDLVYDGLRNNATASFKLGGLDVSLVDYSKEIIIGGIKEFYLRVDSIWSEVIPNLKANVSVFNYSFSQNPLTSFETLTRVLPAWGTETIMGYLDTSKLNLGEFDLRIKLFFANLTKEYEGKFSIVEPPPEPEPEKPSIFSRIFTIKTFIIILVILLLVMLIILVRALLPKKKRLG